MGYYHLSSRPTNWFIKSFPKHTTMRNRATGKSVTTMSERLFVTRFLVELDFKILSLLVLAQSLWRRQYRWQAPFQSCAFHISIASAKFVLLILGTN